ncbi:helix-turn-helix domain-containing protein [Candidatus Dojkabacteria bacterium]|nr:helix-turn-helix domain-containing protein [Candidatus Dojkabacteria bacterium]
MELELEIGASPGSISRIENGKVNPTKETIINIARALKLDTYDIASLFGVDLKDLTSIFKITTKLILSNDLKFILNNVVNELIFRLGYLASALFLVENNIVKVAAFTNSNIGEKVLACLEEPLDKFELSLEKDLNNLTVKSINENRVYVTYFTREYRMPAFSRKVADKIQEVSGDQSNIIYPLATGKKPFGAIVYVKKIKDDFSSEKKVLQLVTKQISISIQKALIYKKA